MNFSFNAPQYYDFLAEEQNSENDASYQNHSNEPIDPNMSGGSEDYFLNHQSTPSRSRLLTQAPLPWKAPPKQHNGSDVIASTSSNETQSMVNVSLKEFNYSTSGLNSKHNEALFSPVKKVPSSSLKTQGFVSPNKCSQQIESAHPTKNSPKFTSNIFSTKKFTYRSSSNHVDTDQSTNDPQIDPPLEMNTSYNDSTTTTTTKSISKSDSIQKEDKYSLFRELVLPSHPDDDKMTSNLNQSQVESNGNAALNHSELPYTSSISIHSEQRKSYISFDSTKPSNMNFEDDFLDLDIKLPIIPDFQASQDRNQQSKSPRASITERENFDFDASNQSEVNLSTPKRFNEPLLPLSSIQTRSLQDFHLNEPPKDFSTPSSPSRYSLDLDGFEKNLASMDLQTSTSYSKTMGDDDHRSNDNSGLKEDSIILRNRTLETLGRVAKSLENVSNSNKQTNTDIGQKLDVENITPSKPTVTKPSPNDKFSSIKPNTKSSDPLEYLGFNQFQSSTLSQKSNPDTSEKPIQTSSIKLSNFAQSTTPHTSTNPVSAHPPATERAIETSVPTSSLPTQSSLETKNPSPERRVSFLSNFKPKRFSYTPAQSGLGDAKTISPPSKSSFTLGISNLASKATMSLDKDKPKPTSSESSSALPNLIYNLTPQTQPNASKKQQNEEVLLINPSNDDHISKRQSFGSSQKSSEVLTGIVRPDNQPQSHQLNPKSYSKLSSFVKNTPKEASDSHGNSSQLPSTSKSKLFDSSSVQYTSKPANISSNPARNSLDQASLLSNTFTSPNLDKLNTRLQSIKQKSPLFSKQPANVPKPSLSVSKSENHSINTTKASSVPNDSNQSEPSNGLKFNDQISSDSKKIEATSKPHVKPTHISNPNQSKYLANINQTISIEPQPTLSTKKQLLNSTDTSIKRSNEIFQPQTVKEDDVKKPTSISSLVIQNSQTSATVSNSTVSKLLPTEVTEKPLPKITSSIQSIKNNLKFKSFLSNAPTSKGLSFTKSSKTAPQSNSSQSIINTHQKQQSSQLQKKSDLVKPQDNSIPTQTKPNIPASAMKIKQSAPLSSSTSGIPTKPTNISDTHRPNVATKVPSNTNNVATPTMTNLIGSRKTPLDRSHITENPKRFKLADSLFSKRVETDKSSSIISEPSKAPITNNSSKKSNTQSSGSIATKDRPKSTFLNTLFSKSVSSAPKTQNLPVSNQKNQKPIVPKSSQNIGSSIPLSTRTFGSITSKDRHKPTFANNHISKHTTSISKFPVTPTPSKPTQKPNIPMSVQATDSSATLPKAQLSNQIGFTDSLKSTLNNDHHSNSTSKAPLNSSEITHTKIPEQINNSNTLQLENPLDTISSALPVTNTKQSPIPSSEPIQTQADELEESVLKTHTKNVNAAISETHNDFANEIPNIPNTLPIESNQSALRPQEVSSAKPLTQVSTTKKGRLSRLSINPKNPRPLVVNSNQTKPQKLASAQLDNPSFQFGFGKRIISRTPQPIRTVTRPTPFKSAGATKPSPFKLLSAKRSIQLPTNVRQTPNSLQRHYHSNFEPTVPQSPPLSTRLRAQHNSKSTAIQLNKPLKPFKAHPVNWRVLESRGDLGVPKINKRELTVPVSPKFNDRLGVTLPVAITRDPPLMKQPVSSSFKPTVPVSPKFNNRLGVKHPLVLSRAPPTLKRPASSAFKPTVPRSPKFATDRLKRLRMQEKKDM